MPPHPDGKRNDMENTERSEWCHRFRACLRDQGLRLTRQRETIVGAFLSCEGHLSIDELYQEVRGLDERIGYATVYRTLRLLKDCGLASEHRFGGSAGRFEPAGPVKHQHEHFVCTQCGAVLEHSDGAMQRALDEVASQLDFRVERHELEVWGCCKGCETG